MGTTTVPLRRVIPESPTTKRTLPIPSQPTPSNLDLAKPAEPPSPVITSPSGGQSVPWLAELKNKNKRRSGVFG